METTRDVTFVIKSSKLCNLRCRYCYEMADLAKRDRMSPEDLRRMFANIGDYYTAADRRQQQRTHVKFIWHGGEPLLIEPQYYWDAFADQRRIIGDRLAVSNTVQTNLTVLDGERLRLLRDGFQQVGVSVDLFGGHRVNIAGRDMQKRVLANMDRLRRAGIAFGCITVLHRGNIDKIDRIWNFYREARIPFRVLPLFDGASPDQNEALELNGTEISQALCRLADLWLSDDSPVQILPLSGHVQAMARYLSRDESARRYYNKRDWCWALLVNTNGDCFSNGDPYGAPEWSLGNIFTTPLAEIFASEAFERSAQETDKRIAANCLGCPFFGACDGRHIGDHIDNIYLYQDGQAVCGIDRTVLTHMERRLRDAGLVEGAADDPVLVPALSGSS